MTKEFLIQLTNALYRLTLLFPKKEPLRYKMRELADDILAGPAEENLDVLDSFFEVAKAQNWVKQDDILAVQKEYDNLKGALKKEKKSTEPKSAENNEILKENPVDYSVLVGIHPELELSSKTLPERQEKILEFLKENGRAQVWQVKQILPEVTKRTLRRDFEHMLKQGLIERVGEKNDTFYQVKIRES